MDANKLNKIMSIVRIALALIGVLACLLVVTGPNMESTEEVRNNFRDGGSMSFAINYTIFIIIGTALAVLLFFGLQLATNTKKTVMSIVGVLAALVLYLIFWVMGTSDTNESLHLTEAVQVSDSTLGSSTAGLFTALVGVLIGGLAWLLGPLMGRLRK